MVLGRARIHPRRPDSTLEPLAHTRGSVPGHAESVHHRSKRPRISKSRSTLRAKLLKGLGLPRNWVCLVFSPSTASRRPMAFHDLVMRFSDSLLRLFYRGRLGFPRTKAQNLLKTKDVAVCDWPIGVGPTAPWQEFSDSCERDPISSRQEMRASKKAAGLGQTTAQACATGLESAPFRSRGSSRRSSLARHSWVDAGCRCHRDSPQAAMGPGTTALPPKAVRGPRRLILGEVDSLAIQPS